MHNDKHEKSPVMLTGPEEPTLNTVRIPITRRSSIRFTLFQVNACGFVSIEQDLRRRTTLLRQAVRVLAFRSG